MIISASRRTDIPNYYFDWFFNRIKEGYLYVRNPMNPHQISEIDLSPDLVDCIIFWTKNPEPMIERLEVLSAYKYYFQFTLTGYGRDIECNVPHKKDMIIPLFQRLSIKTGKEKVIWRYDPILFTDKYTMAYHLSAFKQIACALKGYTDKCVISFVDIYVKNKKRMESLERKEIREIELRVFAKELADIARDNGITVASCAEKIDLTQCGIEHNCCIDKKLIEKIVGCNLKVQKDKNQRAECGCIESVEIGTYHTCLNECNYCYANFDFESAKKNFESYDPNAPLLCGTVSPEDKVTPRKVKSLREEQLRFL